MLVRTIYQLRQDVDYLKSIVLGTGAPVRGNVSEQSLISDGPGEAPDEQFARVVQQDSPDTAAAPPHEDAEMKTVAGLSIERTELALIKRALDKYKGNRKLAAEELGISERTLYRKLKTLDNA